jgi:transposase
MEGEWTEDGGHAARFLCATVSRPSRTAADNTILPPPATDPYVEGRIKAVNAKVEAYAAEHEAVSRLVTIPGIGALGATALVAAAGDGRQFKKARDLAAWLGLVPAEHSTGGKQTLLGISKRGNRYVRWLIIHGAR